VSDAVAVGAVRTGRPASLVPATMKGTAHRHKRMGVAFGRRFFLLLAVGLVWSVPAFADLRLGLAMLAWDVLLAIAWLVDLGQISRAEPLVVQRSWRSPLSLSVESAVDLTIENRSTVGVTASIVDGVPSALSATPPRVRLAVGAHASATASYPVRPGTRGDLQIDAAFLRCQGPLGIAERWLRADLAQVVRVYPNLADATRGAVYLARSRQIEQERRHTRLRGRGREFDSLREYRAGDEIRDVCWTAAARRGKLVTRTYTVERSQTIWITVDSGRLMRARVGGLAKLDYAVNAALSLAHVALHSGDRVGLLTYGRTVRHRVPAARGSAHLRELIEQLAAVREEGAEADHLQAAGRLLADQRRRSLVVWLTDLADTAMTPEVVEAASRLSPRHLVLFIVIGQPDLGELADREPATEREMFQVAAAQEVVHRRELLLARLRDRGILALEADSATLSPTVVNSYLEIKERNRI